MVGGTFTSSSAVISGVPKGLVLSPVLFLVYINDFTDDIHSQIRLFADDCLVYRLINSINDHQILQRDLNTLIEWSKKWQLEFNVRFSRCLHVT